jgi:polyhydroxyalkanoate synthesis regulator phasin
MGTYPELAREFVDSLKSENANAQEQIEQIEKTGMRIGERPYGGTWSDVTDREITSLKGDIASREQTIARLEEELRAL